MHDIQTVDQKAVLLKNDEPGHYNRQVKQTQPQTSVFPQRCTGLLGPSNLERGRHYDPSKSQETLT
jgi:hypothetical protein